VGTIGTGIYTPREVAAFAGIRTRRLKDWLSASGKLGPIIAREDDHGPSLTFLDLIEVLFVKSFLDQGVKMRTIHEAAKQAVTLFGHHHPFAVRRFETDGRKIFATLAHKDKATNSMLDVVDNQAVFASVLARYIRQIDYDKLGDASRWWPLGKDQPIFADPEFSFGAPLTKSGHVPTYAIHSALEAGDTAEMVARWFEIPLEEVRAAERFQQGRMDGF
jgi:uncharacterized protein (DUF433 family)